MTIPGLGAVSKGDYDEYRSQPIPVPVLSGKRCRFIVDGYDEDPDKEAFHAAIANFLASDNPALKGAEQHIFHYCKDCEEVWKYYGENFERVESPSRVWRHVRLGTEPVVSRRSRGDKGVYVSLECNCDWEEEHGLQIVFRNGNQVNKVGPFDGHLTNSDAFADETLENVVYKAVA